MINEWGFLRARWKDIFKLRPPFIQAEVIKRYWDYIFGCKQSLSINTEGKFNIRLPSRLGLVRGAAGPQPSVAHAAVTRYGGRCFRFPSLPSLSPLLYG